MTTNVLSPDQRQVRIRVGTALASRWPLGDVGEIDPHVIDRTDDFPWAAAMVRPEPLLFVHHKPSWPIPHEYEREQQAARCARFVEEQLAGRDMHLVLASDFETTPDSATIRFWTGRQSLDDISVAYQDAREAVHPDDAGHTFSRALHCARPRDSLDRGRGIDYIMVRCGVHGPALDVADCLLAFDEPVRLSRRALAIAGGTCGHRPACVQVSRWSSCLPRVG